MLLSQALLFSGDYDVLDTFYFPFYLDGSLTGEVEVGLDSIYEPNYINAEELYILLERRFRQEYIEFLQEAEWVSFSDMQEQDIPVVYNEMTLELSMEIPPEAALPRDFSVLRPRPQQYGLLVEPLDFSSYTNISSSFSYSHQEPVRIESITLEPHMQVRDLALESRFSFNSSQDSQLAFSDNWFVRGVTYSDDTNARLTIEDQPSGGERTRTITYERRSSLGISPRSNTRYVQDLMLQSPARVTLRMNERDIFSQQLRQGEHSFRDFSLSPGVNELQVIRERDGEEPAVDTILIPYDPALIPRGSSEYSFGLSFKSFDTLVTDPLEDLRVMGYVKSGLSHTMSSTYNFDITQDRQVHGITLDIAALSGSYRVSNEVTIQPQKIDYRGAFNYRLYDRITNRSFGFTTLLNTGSSFITVDDDVEPVSESELSIGLTYAQALFPNLAFSTSFKVAYDWKIDDPEERFTPEVSTTLRHRLNFGNRSSLYTDVAVTDWLDFTMRVSAFLSFSLADNRATASARHTMDTGFNEEDEFTINHTTNLQASYRPERSSRFGPVQLNVSGFDYDTDGLPTTASISGSYQGDIFTARTQHTVDFSGTPQFRGNLRVNTAIAYADRVLALTRPISNSFVIVKAGPALEDTPVGINPRGSVYAAQTNRLGTAVLSSVSAFGSTSIMLEPIDPPDDLYFSENQFRFQPRYRQAAVIRPGAEFRLMLTGRLFLSEGVPLEFAAGDIIPIDSDDEEDMEFFFTDDTGQLFAFDLTAGEYYMNIYLRSGVETLQLSIPEGIRGTATIRDVYLSGEEVGSLEVEDSALIYLTGRILYPDGTPAALAEAELSGQVQSYSVVTGEGGHFTIPNLSSGTYEFTCSLCPRGEVWEIVLPADLRGEATVGDLILDGDRDGLSVTQTASTTVHLTGHILYPDERPLAHSHGELVREDDDQEYIKSFSTNESGQFSLTSIRPGNYLLTLRTEAGYVYYRITIPLDAREGVMTVGTIVLPGGTDQEIHKAPEVMQHGM